MESPGGLLRSALAAYHAGCPYVDNNRCDRSLKLARVMGGFGSPYLIGFSGHTFD